MPHVLTTEISAWKTRPEFDHKVGYSGLLKEKEGEQGLKSTTSSIGDRLSRVYVRRYDVINV